MSAPLFEQLTQKCESHCVKRSKKPSQAQQKPALSTTMSDAPSLTTGASLLVVSKNPMNFGAKEEIAMRKEPCDSAATVDFIPTTEIVTFNGKSSQGCGATWLGVTTKRGVSGYVPNVFLRQVGVIGGATCKPVAYPKFNQCDRSWSYAKMLEGDLCERGEVVSALASVLAHVRRGGRMPDGSRVDPNTLNQWLKENKGYLRGDLVDYRVLGALGLRFVRSTKDEKDIMSSLCSGDIVLGQMKNMRGKLFWKLLEGFEDRKYLSGASTYYFDDLESVMIFRPIED